MPFHGLFLKCIHTCLIVQMRGLKNDNLVFDGSKSLFYFQLPEFNAVNFPDGGTYSFTNLIKDGIYVVLFK